ncbi:GGDEF domain-containing protein [Pseudomonas sp. 5P_3.1_Bac2]|uniref:GGDEF domain-containing protein n=1 Tax=Pseudomonas sp. 5P_3.1_Bac2 TaxID=2971617 RepID=UPI0021CA5FAF|nr:GGDEF domain-containing protein [Pseudomonas sp. 5P_3.1_Bac2]MCU1717736.1 GGDEF domain-containing protein [Pseudomonas sp. 5P_3.1_Bac2]
MDSILSLLSETLPEARTLEELARPLLRLLRQVTGMESTYLTTIDTEAGVQRVEYALNSGEMVIPEGLEVPWGDTLCKRALEENRLFTDNVSECWGDSEAAAALGIRTYASSPIHAQDGRVLGTVCAASAQQLPLSIQVEPLLKLLSGLLSYSLERDLLVKQLRAANGELTKLALTDVLTGLANRRAIMDKITRLFALAEREEKFVLLAVIDLDGFKQINDRHGHLAGDEFLRGIAQQLQQSLRAGDMIGRTGGDEFIVLGLASSTGADASGAMASAAEHLQQRLTEATIGTFNLGSDLPAHDYAGASVGVVALRPQGLSADEAIKQADDAMYRVKQQRKQQRLAAS